MGNLRLAIVFNVGRNVAWNIEVSPGFSIIIIYLDDCGERVGWVFWSGLFSECFRLFSIIKRNLKNYVQFFSNRTNSKDGLSLVGRRDLSE